MSVGLRDYLIQRMAPLEYVHSVCNRFFQRLSARIIETRASLTGRVNGVTQQLLYWKDRIGLFIINLSFIYCTWQITTVLHHNVGSSIIL